MKESIIFTVLLALFVSDRAYACGAEDWCYLTLEYQGAYVSSSDSVIDYGQYSWKLYGCEILCKGNEICMEDCTTNANINEDHCDHGANGLIVRVEYQNASASAMGEDVQEGKADVCQNLCSGMKNCLKDCEEKGEIKRIQFMPGQNATIANDRAGEVTVTYQNITATAAALGGGDYEETKLLAKANACEILCKGAKPCVKNCITKGKIIHDSELVKLVCFDTVNCYNPRYDDDDFRD